MAKPSSAWQFLCLDCVRSDDSAGLNARAKRCILGCRGRIQRRSGDGHQRNRCREQPHTIAVNADGVVSCWGRNNERQCDVPAGLSEVTRVSAGLAHSLALRANGTVVAWGRNDAGQSTVPSTLANVVAIDAGDNHAMALRNNGSVVCWGLNTSGQAPFRPVHRSVWP